MQNLGAPYVDFCDECQAKARLCIDCGCCDSCCECQAELFDADELGIDPEVDAERFERA